MIIDNSLVKWVALNYLLLSRGEWPDPEVDDNYRYRSQVSRNAPFENPVILAAEVSSRIARCGTDGLLFEECYGMRTGEYIGPAQVAKKRHMEFEDTRARINKVIWYCTDDKHGKRRESYAAWKKKTHGNRKYREKVQ